MEVFLTQNLRVFQHKTEGFIQRQLVRNASQNPVKKCCTRHEEIAHLKNPHNIKTQLGNYAQVTNEIVMGKKKRIIKTQLSPKVSQ